MKNHDVGYLHYNLLVVKYLHETQEQISYHLRYTMIIFSSSQPELPFDCFTHDLCIVRWNHDNDHGQLLTTESQSYMMFPATRSTDTYQSHLIPIAFISKCRNLLSNIQHNTNCSLKLIICWWTECSLKRTSDLYRSCPTRGRNRRFWLSWILICIVGTCSFRSCLKLQWTRF